MRQGENIRLRPDGRFEARYPKKRDSQGRILQYGSCYGQTYEEAKAKRDLCMGRKVFPSIKRGMNLLILGAGSHGQEVCEIARALHIFESVCFLDDDPENVRSIGTWDDSKQLISSFPMAIPAVGNMELQKKNYNRLIEEGFIVPTLVHPSVILSGSAEIGVGSVLCARATIGAGAKIGKGCIISSGATIGRDAVLPDWTYVEVGEFVTREMMQATC